MFLENIFIHRRNTPANILATNVVLNTLNADTFDSDAVTASVANYYLHESFQLSPIVVRVPTLLLLYLWRIINHIIINALISKMTSQFSNWPAQ